MVVNSSQLLKSFLWKLLERCSVQVVTFVVTIVLARLLMPEEYGIVALITIFIALAEVIADGGFNTALIQKKDADSVDFSTVFFFSLAIAITLYVLLYACAPFIAGFYNQPMLTPVVRVLSASILFYSINSVQRAYISRNMLFKKLFISALIAVLLSGSVGIYLAYIGYGVWSLVWQTILNQLFTTVIMWFTVKWRPTLAFSRERFYSLFGFGWKIFCTNFIVTLFIRLRAMVIGKVFSPATLAYYDKGNQFPGLISDNVCGSIQTVIFPALSDIQDDKGRVKSMMRRSINTSCLFMFPLMVGLMVCAKPLVVLLLTEKWLGVVPYMQILCLANFFRPITIPNQQAITALGYSGITLKLEIIRKLIDIIILTVSCCLGALAIAWGVVLFNFICIFVNLIPNVKLLDYKIHEQIIDLIPTFIISIIMGASIYWINLLDWSPFLQIFAMTVLGGVIYFTLCYLLKVESFNYLLSSIVKRQMR